MPRTSIKGQVLANLVAKFTESPHWKRKEKSKTWMENQLAWFPYKSLYPGGYTLMVQQIKEDLKLG